jgi:phosphate transport system substrate-binding protein
VKTKRYGIVGAGLALWAVALAGCGNNASTQGGSADAGNTGAASTDAGNASGGSASAGGADLASLKGTIQSDGSSTVGPITQAMAEEFGKQAQGVRITVATSGTGGGFTKFASGETQLQNASRPIKSKEAAAAAAKKVEYIEIPVAYDGIAVVVNPKNTWATDLTAAELKKIWAPGSKVNNWSQVRAGFPNRPLKLYGPGTSSGTFDYFTDEINGEEGKSRSDYTASEDDNTLVEGVSRDAGALGYFGYGYFQENKDKLKLVKVDGVEPNPETIASNEYKPLSRPLFIYVSRKAADDPAMSAFVNFYLENKDLVTTVGYVPLPDDVIAAARKRWEAKTAGTAFSDATKGKTLTQIYGA